jgi:hypothetical protein
MAAALPHALSGPHRRQQWPCTVPEVISFARTIETWQAPIIAA